MNTKLTVRLIITAVVCYPALTNAQQNSTAIDQRVAVLIEQMTKRVTEQKAFAELEALGCAAVPATIRQMDDRRTLPDPRISLRNKSPQAFEGLRHYGPEKVVDALAAILNQVTGQHFGFIYNGATDEERNKAVQGWREYLRTTPIEKLCSHRAVDDVAATAQQCYAGHSRYQEWRAKKIFPYRSSVPQSEWAARTRKLHKGQSTEEVLGIFAEPDYVEAGVSKKGDRFLGCVWIYDVQLPEDVVNYKRNSWIEIFFDSASGRVFDFVAVNIEGIPSRPFPSRTQ